MKLMYMMEKETEITKYPIVKMILGALTIAVLVTVIGYFFSSEIYELEVWGIKMIGVGLAVLFLFSFLSSFVVFIIAYNTTTKTENERKRIDNEHYMYNKELILKLEFNKKRLKILEEVNKSKIDYMKQKDKNEADERERKRQLEKEKNKIPYYKKFYDYFRIDFFKELHASIKEPTKLSIFKMRDKILEKYIFSNIEEAVGDRRFLDDIHEMMNRALQIRGESNEKRKYTLFMETSDYYYKELAPKIYRKIHKPESVYGEDEEEQT